MHDEDREEELVGVREHVLGALEDTLAHVHAEEGNHESVAEHLADEQVVLRERRRVDHAVHDHVLELLAEVLHEPDLEPAHLAVLREPDERRGRDDSRDVQLRVPQREAEHEQSAHRVPVEVDRQSRLAGPQQALDVLVHVLQRRGSSRAARLSAFVVKQNQYDSRKKQGN